MLSVVVPSYNSRDLALSSAARLDAFLSRRFKRYEVIFVDDGSRADEQFSQDELPAHTRLLRFEGNRGKGAAVRAGMLSARGRVRLFTDVDLPYDLLAIPNAYAQVVERKVDAVFGDRSLRSSSTDVATPALRRATSWTLRKLVALFVVSGMCDTQCGFKVFSAELADALFPTLRVDGFGFDVEIYYVLAKHDIRVLKVPVKLVNRGRSSVSPLRTGALVAGARRGLDPLPPPEPPLGPLRHRRLARDRGNPPPGLLRSA
jgi:dolichyl-phosphate beta-glucosyltransferase